MAERCAHGHRQHRRGNVADNSIFSHQSLEQLNLWRSDLRKPCEGSDRIGIGTTILTGSNTYTGGTTINAGMLQVGNGDTTGSSWEMSPNNGIFAVNRSKSSTLPA